MFAVFFDLLDSTRAQHSHFDFFKKLHVDRLWEKLCSVLDMCQEVCLIVVLGTDHGLACTLRLHHNTTDFIVNRIHKLYVLSIAILDIIALCTMSELHAICRSHCASY